MMPLFSLEKGSGYTCGSSCCPVGGRAAAPSIIEI